MIREVVKHDSLEAQRRELVALMAEQELQPSVQFMRPKKLRITHTEPVRCVAYFNPFVFVRQRLRERKRHQRLLKFVKELNARLASVRSRLDEHGARFAITERLFRHALAAATRDVCLRDRVQQLARRSR